MIIKDTETLVKHIGVNFSFEYERIAPHLDDAEYDFLIPLIGQTQYDVFNSETEIVDPIIKTALKFARNAVANFAYYLGLPEFSVQVTDGGIFVAGGDNVAPASDKQFKELQRAKKKAGHKNLDRLVNYMEANKAKFTAFTTHSAYVSFKSLLVYNTATFQKYFNIFDSYQTYKALVPQLIIVEDQFIKYPVQADLLAELKKDQTEDLRKEVKELLQKAVVAFTIYKTVDNGLFILNAEGIHLKFDQLPYEKTATNINLKINDFLLNTKKSKRDEGEEYLKQALAIIKENPDDFTEYIPIPDTGVKKISMTKTPGIIGI